MPLAFQSINRGVIPFGFFNIETDMLLLDQYFFFAGEFCNFIGDLAEQEKEAVFRSSLAVDLIADRQQIGDLMGAIHDVHYSGFIGEVYRRFPFPRREEDFKQKPSGSQNREALKKLIAGYAEKIEIQFQADPVQETVLFGELLFRKVVFQELILYVWQGGYPRWMGEERPEYVLSMKERISKSTNWLFEGIQFV